jgi:hypothetical protein
MQQTKTHTANGILFFVLALLLLSCTAIKQTANNSVQRVPPKFDFSPISRAEAGAAGLTIALVNPSYVQVNASENLISPYSDMATKMAQDFQELLTAKGFTIRGPFGSRDEMTFSDKTNSNIAFSVSIDLQREYNRKYNEKASFGALISKQLSNSYKMKGEIVFRPTLVITAYSPQYGELLWKKNITLKPAIFNYTGTKSYDDVPEWATELKEDNTVYNLVSEELDKIYKESMALAWQQIDVAEMKTVAEQARKADKKGN